MTLESAASIGFQMTVSTAPTRGPGEKISKIGKIFGDYILFSRENKVQTFFFRVHWLSEDLIGFE